MLTYVVITLIVFTTASFVVYRLDPQMPPMAFVIIAGVSLLWPVAAVGIGVAVVIAALTLIRLKKNDEAPSEVFDDRHSP